jgi:hypothetical protein
MVGFAIHLVVLVKTSEFEHPKNIRVAFLKDLPFSIAATSFGADRAEDKVDVGC